MATSSTRAPGARRADSSRDRARDELHRRGERHDDRDAEGREGRRGVAEALGLPYFCVREDGSVAHTFR
jgi:hypothetical protein